MQCNINVINSPPCRLMMGFMVTTAFLSMWISNTASTAMMLPIAHAVLDQLEKTEAEADEKELCSGQENQAYEMEETTKEDKGILFRAGVRFIESVVASQLATRGAANERMHCEQHS